MLKINSNQTIITLTIGQLIAYRAKIRFDLACQREYSSAWRLNKNERLDKLFDSIVRGWFIQSVQVVLTGGDTLETCQYIWLLDGNQRLTSILKIYDGELNFNVGGESKNWQNLSADEKAPFLNHTLLVVQHAGMTIEEQTEFFTRLNRGGVVQTTTQAMRGTWFTKIDTVIKGCESLATFKLLNFAKSGYEGLICNLVSLVNGSYSMLVDDVIKAVLNTTTAKNEETITLIKRLDTIACMTESDPDEQKVANKWLKKSHIVGIIGALQNNVDTDNSDIYNNLQSFFSESPKSALRIQYDGYTGSASGNSDSVKGRIFILSGIMNKTYVPKAKKIVDDTVKMPKSHTTLAPADSEAKTESPAEKQLRVNKEIALKRARKATEQANKPVKK